MARKSPSDEELETFPGWSKKAFDESEEVRRWHKKSLETMTKGKSENKRERRRRKALKKDEKKDEERSRSPSRVDRVNESGGDDRSTDSEISVNTQEENRERNADNVRQSPTNSATQQTLRQGVTDSIPKVGKEGEKLQFQVRDRPLFEVHLKYIKTVERRRVLTLEVAKMLEKLAVKYVKMEEYAARTWVVYFDSRAEANRFIHQKK